MRRATSTATSAAPTTALSSATSDVLASGPTTRAFRPTSRRRARVAGGVALAAVAIGGNVLVYSSLNEASEVVQLVTNVRAGDQITSGDLRIVEADLDPTVPHVPGADVASMVGQYAKTYLPAGTLIVPQVVQDEPLVSPGTAVVAVVVAGGGLPAGVIERSRVQLVYRAADTITVVEGRVVARPLDEAADLTITVEVPADAAASLAAAADDVRVVLLDSDVDPAMSGAPSAEVRG